jgi:hypothetical protein
MNELPELRDLPPIDVDRDVAERIAARARGEIGRGESPLRLVEPVLVALLSSSFLVWAALKIAEVFR